jgi:tetratricopeptide (TPR) repeat protein
MPTLLQRNAHALDAISDPAQRARLLAQRAGLLARHWRTAEVPAALARARDAVEACADRGAAAELVLAQALAHYYGGSSADALQSALQALVAAQRIREAGLAAECEAWLAGFRSTLRHPPEQIVPHLHRAVRGGLAHRPVAAARAFYSAGALWQEAGLLDAATALYRRAAQLARDAGDEQLRAAVSRYMTLMQVNDARRAQAAGQLDPDRRRQTIAGLGTAQQLATVLSADELGLQGKLHLGEMRRIEGDDAAAIVLFEEHLPASVAQGLGWETVIARADYALCLARTGREAEARAQAAQAESAVVPDFDAYTRAVVWGTLAELAALLGHPEAAAERADRARKCWAEDAAYGDALRRCLAEQPPLGKG